MGLVGLIGITIGASAALILFKRTDSFKLAVFVFLYGLHLATTLAYLEYTKWSLADAHGYYYDPFRISYRGLGLGTDFIYFVVQNMKHALGGSYLDCFLVFQAFGFIGIAILLKAFEEIYSQCDLRTPIHVYALVSLPSLHFWSAAIGKDAPSLLAVSLMLWSSMRLGKRLVWFAFGLSLMLFLRPHVAVVAAAALAVSLLLGRGVKGITRLLLLAAAVGATILSAVALNTTYNVDVASGSSISQQYDRLGSVLRTQDAGNTAVSGNLIVRFVSLMFRPLFIDATSALALASSPENLLILVLFVSLMFRLRLMMNLVRRVFFVRFAVIYTAFITAFLTLSYWNIGLGLRQKWVMLIPAAFTIFVTLNAVRTGNARAHVRYHPVPRKTQIIDEPRPSPEHRGV